MRLSFKRSCGWIHNIRSCGRMPTMQQATTSADSLGKQASAALHKAETLAHAAHEAAVREAEEAEKTIVLARRRVEQHKAALDAVTRLKTGPPKPQGQAKVQAAAPKASEAAAAPSKPAVAAPPHEKMAAKAAVAAKKEEPAQEESSYYPFQQRVVLRGRILLKP